MLNKRISGKVAKVLKTKKTGAKKAPKKAKVESPVKEVEPKVIPSAPAGPVGYDFKIGSKFMLDGIIFTVKALYKDSNTTQIKLWSQEWGEEISMLDKVKKDIKDDPDFVVLD